MKKTITTTLLAITLLVLTIYSASAQVLEPISDETISVGIQKEFDIKDYVNETYTTDEWNLATNVEVNGETIETENAVFSWTPMFKHGTPVLVEITATATNATNASHEVTSTKTFNWIIDYDGFSMSSINTGDAPRSAIVDEQYNFQLEASSNRNAAVEEYIFSFVDENYPEGMTMSNGKITWTPTTEQFGTHTVEVSAVPKDAPNEVSKITRTFNVDVKGMTIDRVEVRASGSRLETITRSNYLSSSLPYVIDREAELGDEVELRVYIRNNLPDGSDNELRDVEIEIYSYDILSADGQDAFISRIRTGRVEDRTITFTLDPEDLHPDDSPLDIEIRVYGETRDGDMYSDVWDLELRMESKSYDLLISNVDLRPESLCPNNRILVSFDLRNIGTRDLSNAAVRYRVLGTDINDFDRNIEIDYDERRTINKYLTIPKDTVPGEYFLEIIAHPRATSTSDTVTTIMSFNVLDCEAQEEEEEEEKETIIVTPPTDETIVPGTPIVEETGVRSTSIFQREGTIYIVLLTALVVLLAIGVILLLVKVLK